MNNATLKREYQRGGVTFRRTEIGQPQLPNIESTEPWVNEANMKIKESFKEVGTDVKVDLVYWPESRRSGIVTTKRNSLMALTLDTENIPGLIRAYSIAYSNVGQCKETIQEALKFAQVQVDAMENPM